jgi:translation initiation factor IF-2
VTDSEKQVLLAHLKSSSHGDTKTEESGKITHKSAHQHLRIAGSKTISVEVRKKKTSSARRRGNRSREAARR